MMVGEVAFDAFEKRIKSLLKTPFAHRIYTVR